MIDISRNQNLLTKFSISFKKLKSLIRNNFFPILVFVINSIIRPKKLNIGSGKRAWIGWNLLDEIDDLNISYVRFSKQTELKLDSDSQCLIYSSHFLEHIDFETARQVLLEARRVLNLNGYLVIKIPNYDSVLSSYFNGDHKFIEKFSFCDLPKLWPYHMVENNIESKISMIFAGYYTQSYGDHFLRPDKLNLELGYHGPAKLSTIKVREILKLNDPAVICEKLVSVIRSDPEFYRFNHQQAWSNRQFGYFLEGLGFKLISITPHLKNELANQIPDYYSMFEISSYFVLKK
jgi:predicted SAM-dependent methyltransferase